MTTYKRNWHDNHDIYWHIINFRNLPKFSNIPATNGGAKKTYKQTVVKWHMFRPLATIQSHHIANHDVQQIKETSIFPSRFLKQSPVPKKNTNSQLQRVIELDMFAYYSGLGGIFILIKKTSRSNHKRCAKLEALSNHKVNSPFLTFQPCNAFNHQNSQPFICWSYDPYILGLKTFIFSWFWGSKGTEYIYI